MTDYAFNRALCRDYLCAQCHAGLVEIHDDEEGWVVVCHEEHNHEGRIRRETVLRRRDQEMAEGSEVALAYPELAPPRRSVAQDKKDLGF